MNIDIFCARLEKQLARLEGREAWLQAIVEAICTAFQTESHEVALFKVGSHFDQQVLNFLWPPHLAAAASSYVPFSSASSLAVRTFVENRPFINLLFSSTPHASSTRSSPSTGRPGNGRRRSRRSSCRCAPATVPRTASRG